MQFLLLLLSFALVQGKARNKDGKKDKNKHDAKDKKQAQKLAFGRQVGASPKRMLSATTIARQKAKNKKPKLVMTGESLEAGGNSSNSNSNETVSNYRCDFNTDTRDSALRKMYFIKDSKMENKEERYISCRIILNSCFPITSKDQNSNVTASYEEQRARLAEIRNELSLQRLQIRLLVVSALRCDWTLNDRLCIPKDTAERAAEKLVYFQEIFDLAVEGSDGYRLIQRQKELCDKKSKNEVVDDPEFLEEDAEPTDTVLTEEESGNEDSTEIDSQEVENEDTQDDQGAAVVDSSENENQISGNEGTLDDQDSADDSDPETLDEQIPEPNLTS